jgi:hypothetical protein
MLVSLLLERLGCMPLEPLNSPDCNILDLGLFNAIQSAYYWVHSQKNSGDIIKMVEETYNGYYNTQIHDMETLCTNVQTVLQAYRSHATQQVMTRPAHG